MNEQFTKEDLEYLKNSEDLLENRDYWLDKVINNTYSDGEWNKFALWRYVDYITPVILECKDLPLTK